MQNLVHMARSASLRRRPAACGVRPDRIALLAFVAAVTFLAAWPAHAQVEGQSIIHTRGRLWDEVWNTGYIGDGCAWDYCTSAPLGLYPAFEGFSHPVGGESNAINTYANANFHNFRSGVWIVAKNLRTPGLPPAFAPTPTEFEMFAAGGADGIYGAEETGSGPIFLLKNYMEEADFMPLLPEEMSEATWHTNVGITVTRRSYVWSYPGYDDFIIFDYVFKNTGQIVSLLTQEVVPNTQDFQQTLEDVYFVMHHAVSVSTKSQINFHSELTAVQAGAFGWQPPYHDYYHVSDGNTLFFSTNVNGGAEPPPNWPFPVKENEAWKRHFGDELQSPAAFGVLALYADPTSGAPRATPAPDVLRIDTHKGGTFNGQDLDLEFFRISAGKSKKQMYEFATTPSPLAEPGQPGNVGDRFNFYTLSYGPYTLAPGDSVRIIVAEIAGVMDYDAVNAGDPDGHFPDSTIAAIRRNAEHARNVIEWGMGAEVNGIPLAADAPEPPPAPAVDAVNASVGVEKAAIAVTWGDDAETATIVDGSGSAFYNGLEDLDGYRIYRSQDFQYDPAGTEPVLRGADWDTLAVIPKAEFSQYWDSELGMYRFVDETVEFGFRYGYYVAAYNEDPDPWTSANGTVVNDLPELESGSHRRTAPTAAKAGPVASFDIYAVPNPYVFGDEQRSFGLSDPYRIEFRNLPERATIRIYTISGDLIRTIEHGPDARGNLFGTAAWDQKSDSGLIVAPGVYIYHIESATEGLDDRVTGKLMIIR